MPVSDVPRRINAYKNVATGAGQMSAALKSNARKVKKALGNARPASLTPMRTVASDQRAALPQVIGLGYHLVAYIDLLGQSQELEKIRRLPTTSEENDATRVAIQQSAMKVLEIRSHFTSLVKDLSRVNPRVVEQLPPAARASFMRL